MHTQPKHRHRHSTAQYSKKHKNITTHIPCTNVSCKWTICSVSTSLATNPLRLTPRLRYRVPIFCCFGIIIIIIILLWYYEKKKPAFCVCMCVCVCYCDYFKCVGKVIVIRMYVMLSIDRRSSATNNTCMHIPA